MKFAATSEINAPVARVYERLVDYDAHQRLLGQRGVEVVRIDGLDEAGVGATWAASVKFRGKDRHITVELTEVEPCQRVGTHVSGNGLATDCLVQLAAVSQTVTRISVTADVRHRNLTGRLLLQSMRIVKSRLDHRFQARLDAAVGYLGREGSQAV